MAKITKPTKHYNKWRIRWTDADGKRQSAVFERHKEAEYHLRKNLTEAEEIKRGERQKINGIATFKDLTDYWLTNRTPLKRSSKDDQSILRCHLIPHFEKILLKDISVEIVDGYVNLKPHLSRKTISNHLTLLIAMLNLARDLNWLVKPPRIRKPKTPIFSENYRYLRTDLEIKRFLNAAKLEGDHIYALYATAIWSGLRAGELA